MEKAENRTQTLTIRVTPREAEMLRAEANRRGAKSVRAYMREVLMASVPDHVTPSLLLKVLLRFEKATMESLKEAAGDENFTSERVEEIRSQAEANSDTLLSAFQYRESLKVRPQVKTQAVAS